VAEIKIIDILYAAKERYSKNVAEIMNREPLLLQHFNRTTDAIWDGEGKYFVMPLHLEGGQSQGFYAESEGLPPSVAQVGDRYICYPKAMAFTVKITRQNLLAIKQGPGAFFSAKEWEVRQNTISLREKMSRAMWGDGQGVLGVLSGIAVVAGGDSTLTFTNDTNMQYLRKGMFIDVWTPAFPVVTRKRISDMAGGSAAANNTSFDVGWKILEVNRAAYTIKVDGDINAGAAGEDPAAGDYVIPQNEGINLNGATGNLATGKEITGLQAGFSTGQFWNNIQGLAYATLTELQSPRDTAGADRNLTPDLLQVNNDAIEQASGKMINMVGMDYLQFRRLLTAGLQDVRHVSEQVKLGYTKLTWNGKTIFKDRLCPPGKVFLGSTDCIHRVVLGEFGPFDSAAMGERINGKAVYEWAFGADMNLIYSHSQGGGWIENLTKT